MNLTHLRLALLSSLVLLAAGCSSTQRTSQPVTACVPSTKPQYVYQLTGYAVSMFSADSCTGALTALTPASISTGYALPQMDAEQMVVDPKGRFAYVANLVSNSASNLSTISMYTINPSTGVLTATTPATVPTGWLPQGIAIDPFGKFVYTANSDDNTISMFTINQTTGVLTPTVPASIPSMGVLPPGQTSSPGFLTVDPTGKFLYVSNADQNALSMFSINSTTGVLTPTSPATVYAGGISFQVTTDPSGRFAYVVDNLSSSQDSYGVFQYTIDPTTGELTPNTPDAVAAGNGPTAITVDPSGKYAYVVNRLDNSVSMYTVDPTTGNLSPNINTTTKLSTIATGVQPFVINFDQTGKYLYVTNEQSATSVYTVNSDGTLTSVGTTGVATGGLSTAFAVISQ